MERNLAKGPGSFESENYVSSRHNCYGIIPKESTWKTLGERLNTADSERRYSLDTYFSGTHYRGVPELRW